MQAVEPGIRGRRKAPLYLPACLCCRPAAVLFSVIIMPVSAPCTRPHLPRISSGGVRVFLLRHQRGAGGHAVGKLDEVRLAGVKENQIFRKARQMHHTDSRIGKQLQHMIAIGHAVEAVTGGGGKAQPAGQLLAVDLIRRPRQRAAAQRADVERFSASCRRLSSRASIST